MPPHYRHRYSSGRKTNGKRNNQMKTFTVWFRVGVDFRETIEAEDARDAELKIWSKVDDNFLVSGGYQDRIKDFYKTHIYDVVEGVPDE